MSNELVHLVANAERTSKVRAYVQTSRKDKEAIPVYNEVMIADYPEVLSYLKKSEVLNVQIEALSNKSVLGLESPLVFDARIEQGAMIRKGALIGKDAVILMGAVINTKAQIDEKTMIDMNAVIGSGAKIGKRCHIGAGAVIAGMMEPACLLPVVIEDDVLVGANAVVLEGIRIGHHSIIGAGAVVTKDVEPYAVMVGVPAVKIKTNQKDSIIEEGLR